MAKLNDKSKIKVISNTHGSLGTYCNLTDKRYYFPKKESYKTITLEELESMYNDKPVLIDDGFIRFDDVEIYKHLEVPEEIYTHLFQDKEIEELIAKNDAKVIKEKISKSPRQVKENIALKAREMELDSLSKIKAISEETGLDVNPNRENEYDE
jgi:hypothetical protein